jgi:hypothetical protein
MITARETRTMTRPFLLSLTALTLAGAVAPAPVLADSAAAQRHACRPLLASARLTQPAVATKKAEPRAMLLLAVDHRVNGCRVLMRANDRHWIVPEPAPDAAVARFQPASGG